MKDVLADLYFSELCPNEVDNTPQIREAYAAFDKAEAQLESLLEGKQQTLLHALQDAHGELVAALRYEAFAQGFKTGGQLMLQVLGQE